MRHSPTSLDRRRFVAGITVLPATCGIVFPARGARVAGSDRIRVGLIGCGGRGTGAALDAVAADRGVTITSMADVFPDQLASSAALLAARTGVAFDCPAERRHVGLAAWRDVIESDVDLVILATPPAFRPLHAAAAVRAGRHVWCEKPGAVDVAGALELAAASTAAAAAGLSFASGLALRHDPFTAEIVGRIRDGVAGLPLAVTVRSDIGLPWHRPARPDWSPADHALRNWIDHDRYSGGHLVEHHVAAIDKALWVMGDGDPVAVVPDVRTGAIRYVFADGRHVDAAIRRRTGATETVEERVRCTAGARDLRRPAAAPHGDRHPLRTAMAAFVAAVRSGTRLDDGAWLCRATLAAVAGRTALDAGTTVTWSDLHRPAAAHLA